MKQKKPKKQHGKILKIKKTRNIENETKQKEKQHIT